MENTKFVFVDEDLICNHLHKKEKTKMKKCRYFIYGNSGGIEKTSNDIKKYKGLRFRTLKEVFNYIENNSRGIEKENLTIKHYCYDNRINKEVFMVCTNKFEKDDYIKKYGKAIFAGYYLIEL